MSVKVPTNIEVAVEAEGSTASVSWQLDGARYHVWFNLETRVLHTELRTKRAMLYKNPMAEHGTPGHFGTRRLDANNKTNAAVVALVFQKIEEMDLIKRAKNVATKRAAAAQAENVEASRQKRIATAAPRLFDVLKELSACVMDQRTAGRNSHRCDRCDRASDAAEELIRELA